MFPSPAPALTPASPCTLPQPHPKFQPHPPSRLQVNLSPDKARVLSEAYRVLAPGAYRMRTSGGAQLSTLQKRQLSTRHLGQAWPRCRCSPQAPNQRAPLPAARRVPLLCASAGGEMHFSDVYCDRRLPAAVRAHPVLLGECLAGALYVQDFLRLCRQVGRVAMMMQRVAGKGGEGRAGLRPALPAPLCRQVGAG